MFEMNTNLSGWIFTSHRRQETHGHEILTPFKIVLSFGCCDVSVNICWVLVTVWYVHSLHFITDLFCHSEISQKLFQITATIIFTLCKYIKLTITRTNILEIPTPIRDPRTFLLTNHHLDFPLCPITWPGAGNFATPSSNRARVTPSGVYTTVGPWDYNSEVSGWWYYCWSSPSCPPHRTCC